MTTSRFWHDEIRPRLAATAQQTPEWQPWLKLLEATLHEMHEPGWAAATPQLLLDRPAGAPLLTGASLSLDRRLIQNWVWRLLRQASRDVGSSIARPTAFDPRALDALALLEAAICQDEARLVALAATICLDPVALDAVAHLAAMPLLQACGRSLAGQIPAAWSHGYCPICGFWPTLAELRGLERAHRLRCARCGADWGMTWLRCPYCGESDHQRLAFLVPADNGETRRVVTCVTCKGYLKTLTTLQANPGYALVLEDLATVDLDIVALECGYTRPKRPSYTLGLRLLAAPSRLRTLLGWRS